MKARGHPRDTPRRIGAEVPLEAQIRLAGVLVPGRRDGDARPEHQRDREARAVCFRRQPVGEQILLVGEEATEEVRAPVRLLGIGVVEPRLFLFMFPGSVVQKRRSVIRGGSLDPGGAVGGIRVGLRAAFKRLFGHGTDGCRRQGRHQKCQEEVPESVGSSEPGASARQVMVDSGQLRSYLA